MTLGKRIRQLFLIFLTTILCVAMTEFKEKGGFRSSGFMLHERYQYRSRVFTPKLHSLNPTCHQML